jgi:hypothetical protein
MCCNLWTKRNWENKINSKFSTKFNEDGEPLDPYPFIHLKNEANSANFQGR